MTQLQTTNHFHLTTTAFPFDAPADAVGDSSAALYQRTAARRDVVEAERLCARQDGLRLLWRAVDEQDRDD